MNLGIAGRNAVITGGSLGIGYATAHELIANGANVVLIARNRERLEQNAETLRASASVRIVAIAADLAKAEDVERAMIAAQASLGPIDILVNNAGSTPAGGSNSAMKSGRNPST